MRWVTFRGDDGERTGVLSGDAIHALPARRELARTDRARCRRAEGGRGRRAAFGAHDTAGPGDADGADPAAAVDPGLPVLPRPHAQLPGGDGWRPRAQGHLVPDSRLLLRLPVDRPGPVRRRPDGTRKCLAGLRIGDRRGHRNRGQRPLRRRSRTGDHRVHDLQRLVRARSADAGRSIGDRAGQGEGQRRHAWPVSGHARRTRALPPRRQAEPAGDGTGQRRGDRFGVDCADGLELRRGDRLRLARGHADPRRRRRLRDRADLHTGRAPRPDGAGIIPWLAARRRCRHAEGAGSGRDASNRPQKLSAATITGPAQPGCRSRCQAGQPCPGENPLHPRVARGRRPGVGMVAAGRRIRLEQRRVGRR